jgi:DNA-directed RNA polymerase subunit beta'
MGTFQAIRALRIGLVSPEQIRAWSHGEVTRAETIHYRTHKPVPGGLFCEVIFGPVRDWTCACGRFRHARRPGFVCPSCGVELAPATVRRERLGHIELAVPIVHPWFLRDRTVSLLLNLSPWQLAALLAEERYLVLQINEEQRSAEVTRAQTVQDDADVLLVQQLVTLRRGDLLEVEAYHALSQRFQETFVAQTGAEAVRQSLRTLDLDQLARELRHEIEARDQTRSKATRRLQVVNAFRASRQRPEWMVLSVLPVLPPDLRPLLILEGGRMASVDVNAFYARVIHRNIRITRFLAQGAPAIMVKHERRLLQAACSALLDNAHQRKPLTSGGRRALKSLTDLVQGKAGRFRHNLLGKRVDYSGRSVIVPGPQLLLHECGLPKEMAFELFKPFLMHKLMSRHLAHRKVSAKRMIEQREPLVWDLLDEVLNARVVLLNRAPTLHQLSIQAFRPRLIEGKAIQLHPLVCAAFNADFDGDQMAVHVPLGEAAQEEARRLLLSTHNLRHPASGEPVMTPSQEIVLGCFYLTDDRPSSMPAGCVCADTHEAQLAYAAGRIDLHTKLVVRVADLRIFDAPPPTEPHTPVRGRIVTTFGRLLFNEVIPPPLRYRNYPMTKAALKALVAESLATCGEGATVSLLDALKRLGFQYATRSGISLAMSDITIPPAREMLIDEGRKETQALDELYHAGEISEEEWYRKTIDLWSRITEEVSSKLEEALDPYGTLMTIVTSGATKAQFQQIRQLSGIRGLMTNPSGKILPIPVLSNYLLGLRSWEIFIAASGARKGFMDRSLNTATSGYLTRRLVEAGMEATITQEDCHTTEGLLITNEESRRMGLANMRSRITGRVLTEAVGDLPAGTLLDEKLVEALLSRGVAAVHIRSPLTCQAPYGLCRRCYGADLATGRLVRQGMAVGVLAGQGMAVGVLAGQAIGEPGTQLTMRTFHSGGIAHNAADITLGLPRVNALFEVQAPRQPAPLVDREGIVKAIESTAEGYRVQMASPPGEEAARWSYTIPFRRPLMVSPGQRVEIGTPLVEGPLDPQHLLRLVGREAAGRYLLQEVQRVYRATGAVIHDKHLEVIIRHMLRYVRVSDAGDTDLLPGTIIDRFAFMQQVAAVLAQGGRPACACPLLLGLTRSALQTTSWIAAASFQDTSRVLAHAAIQRQQDDLIGLKERLVVGKKLPELK